MFRLLTDRICSTSSIMLQYLKECASGFRFVVPWPSLWWPGHSDNSENSCSHACPPAKMQPEDLLRRLLELSLWIHPKRSALALLLFHALYWYMSGTSNTALSLAAWIGLLLFLYTTWVNKIWPEIRVPTPKAPEPESEEASSADVKQWSNRLRTACQIAIERLQMMRSECPGLFCLVSCLFFGFLGYLGTGVTAMQLFYLTGVAVLTIPGFVQFMSRYVDQLLCLGQLRQSNEEELLREFLPNIQDEVDKQLREPMRADNAHLNEEGRDEDEVTLDAAGLRRALPDFEQRPDALTVTQRRAARNDDDNDDDSDEDFEIILSDELANINSGFANDL